MGKEWTYYLANGLAGLRSDDDACSALLTRNNIPLDNLSPSASLSVGKSDPGRVSPPSPGVAGGTTQRAVCARKWRDELG